MAKSKFKIFFSLILFAVIFFSTYAQGNSNQLYEYINYALQNDSRYMALEEKYIGSKAAIDLARSEKSIMFDLSGNNQLLNSELGGRDFSNSARIGIGASYKLFDNGVTNLSITSSGKESQAVLYELKQRKQEIILRSLLALDSFNRTSESIEIRIKSVEILNRQLRGAQLKYEIGDGTITDVALAQSRLASVQSGLVREKRVFQMVKSEMILIFGENTELESIDLDSYTINLPVSLESALEYGRNNNYSLLQRQTLFEREEKELAKSKKQFGPIISITSRVDYRNQRNFGSTGSFSSSETSPQVLLNFSLPLGTGGKSTALETIASSRLNQAYFEYHNTEKELAFLIRNSWESLELLEELKEYTGVAVTTAELALEGAIKERDAGIRPAIDVLTAEQRLLDSKIAFLNAERSVFSNKVSLASYLSLLR